MLNKLWKMYIVLGKFLCCKWAHIQKSSHLVTMVTHTEGLAINAQITPNIFFLKSVNLRQGFPARMTGKITGRKLVYRYSYIGIGIGI